MTKANDWIYIGQLFRKQCFVIYINEIDGNVSNRDNYI
jgi:hypothetical protein